MNLENFIIENEIAILVIADLVNKSFDIKKGEISLKSNCLYKQLILNNDVETLQEYVEGQTLMPRIWLQGKTLCIVCQPESSHIVAIFLDKEIDAIESYFLAKKMDLEIKELYKMV